MQELVKEQKGRGMSRGNGLATEKRPKSPNGQKNVWSTVRISEMNLGGWAGARLYRLSEPHKNFWILFYQ